jgi:hypothetical protein
MVLAPSVQLSERKNDFWPLGDTRESTWSLYCDSSGPGVGGSNPLSRPFIPKQLIGLASLPNFGFPQIGSVWVNYKGSYLFDRLPRARLMAQPCRGRKSCGADFATAIPSHSTKTRLQPAVSRHVCYRLLETVRIGKKDVFTRQNSSSRSKTRPEFTALGELKHVPAYSRIRCAPRPERVAPQ